LEVPGAKRQPWGSGQVRFRRKVKLEASAAAAERDVHLPGKQRIFMKTQGCALAMDDYVEICLEMFQ